MKFLNVPVSTCDLYGNNGDKPHNKHLRLTTEIIECSIFRCVHSREKSLLAPSLHLSVHMYHHSSHIGWTSMQFKY